MNKLEKGSINHFDILNVEDDYILNRVLTIQLGEAGYSVRSALTGARALELIGERLPSLLLLDLSLPDMSGFELVARLRESLVASSLPLIVHTSLDISMHERSLLTLGPSKFIGKTRACDEHLLVVIAELLTR